MRTLSEDAPTQWYSPSRALSDISLRLRETTLAGLPPEDDTVSGAQAGSDKPSPERMLWIDGVGGYFVTPSDDLLIGQPGEATLGVLADLSRRHARLARVEGRYVLTPYGQAAVAGQPVTGPTVLEDGARFTLGSVEFLLRRPHALSATALLTVVSGHRTAPAADAVLLMAESCVLGPKPHSHIRCDGWRDEAILFPTSEGLACRCGAPLTSQDEPLKQPALLTPGKRIEGQDFALCVEHPEEA